MGCLEGVYPGEIKRKNGFERESISSLSLISGSQQSSPWFMVDSQPAKAESVVLLSHRGDGSLPSRLRLAISYSGFAEMGRT